jgi:hypothetical protein
MQTSKLIYSIFSGTSYVIPEDDVKLLDIGQVPLKDKPKNCNKCYNRGHLGRDKNTLAFELCNCIKKNIDFDYIKTLLPDNIIE